MTPSSESCVVIVSFIFGVSYQIKEFELLSNAQKLIILNYNKLQFCFVTEAAIGFQVPHRRR
jgi:hypothetical protein